MKSTKKCVIENILSHRQSESGKIEYHVKWKKFPLSRATWEPFVNLAQVQDLVRSYWKKYRASQCQKWKNVQLNKQYLLIYDEEIKQIKVAEKQNVDQNIDSNKQEKSEQVKIQTLFQNQDCQQVQSKHLSQKMKFTNDKKCLTKKNTKNKKTEQIDFSQIKKVKAIKYNKFLQKWRVFIEFYDSKTFAQRWINREMLRMGNPFVLLQFYQKLYRLKKTQNWKQIHQLVTQVDYE